ncbi:hypothetical protein KC867_02890 [Candidatus Saccharibacteria bacterium]|nr:hypothetical protein [Candidatus Saccharibacteria bacterium]
MEPDETVDYEDVLPCADKLTFDTRKLAQATATTSAYQNGGSVKPYKCSYCHLWHLSTDYEIS